MIPSITDVDMSTGADLARSAAPLTASDSVRDRWVQMLHVHAVVRVCTRECAVDAWTGRRNAVRDLSARTVLAVFPPCACGHHSGLA